VTGNSALWQIKNQDPISNFKDSNISAADMGSSIFNDSVLQSNDQYIAKDSLKKISFQSNNRVSGKDSS